MPLLTLAQAAKQLTVSIRTLEREIAAGNLPVIEIRGAVRIDETDIAAYIQQSKKLRAHKCLLENAATAGIYDYRSAASASSAALARLLQKPMR